MQRTTKKATRFMAVYALLCAFSIGLASCGSSQANNPSTDGEVNASTSMDNVAASKVTDASNDAKQPKPAQTAEPEEQYPLSILSPIGEVYPYVDQAKAFLLAGEGADVADYYVEGLMNPQISTQIKWKFDGEGTKKFVIEYATRADYSDAIKVEVGATKRSIDVYNLYKGVNYYLRISSVNAQGEIISQSESEFKTTDLGPRVMNIDGACNARDLGGYETSFGKSLIQGIAYRGGMLHYNATGNSGDLTEAGKKTLSEELGVTSELDFRDAKEAWVTDGSSIPGATLTYITAGGYEDIFAGNGAKVYRNIFAYLADETNYPLYYHCTAGADRTGTVSYILHAFLGVSELECHQDFAFTSFSVYKMRGSHSGRGENADRYWAMVNQLKTYEGDTLQQKAENYLLSIGVTQAELDNIKGIFFGEVEIPNAKIYNPNVEYVPARTQKQTANEAYLDVVEGWTIDKKALAQTREAEGYSTYTVTGISATAASTASVLNIYSVAGDKLPKEQGDWSAVYTLEENSGAGLTINGEAVTSGRIKLPGDLYLPLDVPAEAGDIFVIDGAYVNADKQIRLVFDNCAMQWDGTAWKTYDASKVYTTYNLGTLSVHKHSSGQTHNVPVSTALYMARADGEAFPYEDGEWQTKFSYESGDGWRLNGEKTTEYTGRLVSSNAGLYVDLSQAGVKVGDILTVEGTFTCEDKMAKYVIEKSTFTWNGTAWENHVTYTTYDIGTLAFAKVTDTNDATPIANGYLYLKRADGQKLPIFSKENNLNWDTKFSWKNGVGITINGQAVTATVKFPNEMFIAFKAAPQVGDILKIGGTFYSEAIKVEYLIAESTFEWDGSTWVACVNYTTYNIGKLAFSKSTTTNDQRPIANGYVYFNRADGKKIPIHSTENDINWEAKFNWKDGVGITINDQPVTATVKFPNEMFVAFRVAPKLGDILKIGGTFYSEELIAQYNIEESAFQWDGTAWLPYGGYTEYEVGELTVSTTQESSYSLVLNRADGENFAVDNLTYSFNFYGGSGAALQLNSQLLSAKTIKTSADDLRVELGVQAKEGDVVTIGGTFYNLSLMTKYIITESAFIYQNGAWSVYDSDYAERGMGVVSIMDEISSESFIYFAPATAGLTLPVDSWDDAFVCVYGVGVELNGSALTNPKLRSIDGSLYLSLRAEDVTVGNVVTIGGKFVCETQSALYYVTETTFVWNGTVWEAENATSLSTWKEYAKTELDTYKNLADYEISIQKAITKLVTNAKSDINECDTVAELSKVVADAKLAMDELTKVTEPEIPDEPETPSTSEDSDSSVDTDSSVDSDSSVESDSSESPEPETSEEPETSGESETSEEPEESIENSSTADASTDSASDENTNPITAILAGCTGVVGGMAGGLTALGMAAATLLKKKED